MGERKGNGRRGGSVNFLNGKNNFIKGKKSPECFNSGEKYRLEIVTLRNSLCFNRGV